MGVKQKTFPEFELIYFLFICKSVEKNFIDAQE
jgi:hypothetical protein